jgi:tRNA (guanine-N7-)-methyltransferase
MAATDSPLTPPPQDGDEVPLTRTAAKHAEWLRSYGRRRGRARSSRQAALFAEVLPRVAVSLAQPPPSRLAALWGGAARDVWLEIGFGGGEHLLWQARNNAAVGIIGCEPFCDGIIKVLAAVDTERLGNIRLFADDARPLLAWLPAASIGRAFALFPDPWPKKRHHKRRLISEATLASVARVMRRESELRLATDVADYAEAILAAVRGQGDFFIAARGLGEGWERPPDWPATRYEEKARRGDRDCHFFSLRRR